MAKDSDLLAALNLVNEGKHYEALTQFEVARSSAESVYQVGIILLNQARCLEELARFEEAKNKIEEATALINAVNPNERLHFDMHLQAAHIFLAFSEGKFDKGINDAKAFLSRYHAELQRPEFCDMKYDVNLTVAFQMVRPGFLEDAIEALRNILPMAKDGDKFHILLFIGIASEELGNHDSANDSFEQFLESDDESLIAEAHYRLGAIYLN